MKTKLQLITALLFFATVASAYSMFAGKKHFSDDGILFLVTTQVQSSQCGQVLPALNTTIMANTVSGATAYRFKVVTEIGDNQFLEQIVTNPTRGFTLTQMGAYKFATTYHIRVASYYQGIWQPYGADCTVTTPTPITKIQNSQCALTLSNMTDVIYADAVSYAAGYRFRVTNVADPSEVYLLDRSLREFRMNLIPTALYGANYAVEVAVKNLDGNYLPYGGICGVNTPLVYTKIQSSQCGSTLGSMGDIIYADFMPNCISYRFKVVNATNQADVHIIDRPLREFRMNLLANIQYNTNYLVEVAIRYGTGNYLQYGPVCTIRTPGYPSSKIQLSQCEMVAVNTTDYIYADPISNAAVYRFRLQNNETGYNHYVDNVLGYYKLNMFSGLQPGTTYTVKVAVKLGGIFTPYGKGCAVTTPGSPPGRNVSDVGIKENGNGLSVTLYPNPFVEDFNVGLATPTNGKITIKVYDAMGRLLETINAAADETSLKIGSGYQSGVYNVIVSQGENVQAFRMIKR